MASTDTVMISVSAEEVQGNLMYCLLTDAVVVENKCVPVYGVSIAFERADCVELEKIHNITTIKDEMLGLMGKMIEGMVFPISLKDIVEDYIA